eukprot:4040175-Alexandrium_andersonii.AAC.1
MDVVLPGAGGVPRAGPALVAAGLAGLIGQRGLHSQAEHDCLAELELEHGRCEADRDGQARELEALVERHSAEVEEA